MSLLRGVATDNNDRYDVTLDNAGDITGATVTARVRLVGSNPPIREQVPAALLDPVNSKIQLILTTDTLPHGRWSVQWEVHYEDGTILTWPQLGRDYLILGRKN